MRFSELVAVSQRVSEASGRLEKVDLLADALRRLEPSEVPAGVGLLAGHPRQGRIGVGFSALQAASEPDEAPPSLFDAIPARGDPPLTVEEVDAALARLA